MALNFIISGQRVSLGPASMQRVWEVQSSGVYGRDLGHQGPAGQLCHVELHPED